MAKKISPNEAGSLKLSPAASLAGVKGMLEKASPRVSVIGAVVGAGIDSISATRDERAFLSDLVDEYRPEVAKRLGLSEQQVTAQHFDAAFKENPVLAQAKQVTSMKKVVRLVSNAASVVGGVIAGFGASIMVRRGQQVEGMQQNAADIAGTLAATFGGMSVGKVTRRVLHMRGREGALEDTAHGQIMVIKNKQQMGEPTDAADIFKVQLAVNQQVNEAIQRNFGKNFSEMAHEEQTALMQNEFADIFEANQEMARRINEGARPQGLLFADVEDVKAKEEAKAGNRQEVVSPAHNPEAGAVENGVVESSPAFEPLPAPPEQVKTFHQQEQAPSGVAEPISQQPMLEQNPVTVETAPPLSPEAQKRLIQSLEENMVPAAQPEQQQEQQPSYTKEEHEAVHSALKAALGRRPAGELSHVEGVERERAVQTEAQAAR